MGGDDDDERRAVPRWGVTFVPQIFDRELARRRRARAAAHFGAFDFLAVRAAEEIGERLAERKEHFATAVRCGARIPIVTTADRVISFDTAAKFLSSPALAGEAKPRAEGESGTRADFPPPTSAEFTLGQTRSVRPGGSATSPATAGEERIRALAVVGDEERLPFAAGALDLYASVLTLHGVNDVPGALAQVRRALRPNGTFIAAMFGGETLRELRQAFAEAEIECDGGLSPRVFPFADLRDVGNLLQRAGFAEPIVDADTVTVHYSDPLKLLRDLRGMGESNVLSERRRKFLKRRTLERMCEIYVEKFGTSDGRVPATFQIFYLSGRARFEAQQQPLEDGKRMRLS